jgi:hypothetical protein
MKNKRNQIFVSIDVESDGPIPGPHSMLSLGAVAFTEQGDEIGTYYVNFDLLPDAQPHPDTQVFWAQNQESYDQTRVDTQDPTQAMKEFVMWIKQLPGVPVAVAAPAGFDFMFTYWYLMRFAGHSPFSFSCIDVKTMVMTMLKLPYRESGKRAWRKSWQSGLPHTHHALEDAREQGISFCKMLQELHGT